MIPKITPLIEMARNIDRMVSSKNNRVGCSRRWHKKGQQSLRASRQALPLWSNRFDFGNGEQMRACRTAPTGRGWGPDHWEALILTVYDTSLRIGCLMKIPATSLLAVECRLLVPGEFQKGGADTYQTLHPDTAEKLQRLPRGQSDRLFPWPYAREELWRRLESLILVPAGLPHGRRDKFHRLRRTSYTLVAKAFGVQAASRHAAHKQDLSRYYLDRSMIDANPLDALPRPV